MPDAARWERIWALYEEIVARPSEEWSARLDQSCGQDPDLRAEVEELLSGSVPPSHFLDRLPGHPGSDEPDPEALLGGQIGPYRLHTLLGIGGMGIVYEAEQLEPIKRRVALKLIRGGVGSRRLVARFESERQALALMAHPNIAKVLDLGTSDDGRPYFVMELVSGRRITTYCDDERLTTRERLEIFLPVCDAVQHAHQKGIVHRDLKPSNIVVAAGETSGEPRPQVIDFGVAKLLDPGLARATAHTRVGTLLGTPDYMSPEQWEMAADVDTRTDVYSLGVVLYELLTGEVPVALADKPFAEALEIHRTHEPIKPSTRVSALDHEAAEHAAARRRVPPDVLRKELSGELDWITMKALEKDRERRYSSVSELAADLQRYLRDEPVAAGPPSTAYRLRKFVRRHRFATAMVCLVTTFALVLGVLLSVQAGRIAQQRDRANAEAATAERVIDFLVELFRVSSPGRSLGSTVSARELLDRGAESIGEELADQPDVHARLLETLGEVYVNLGLHDEARPLLQHSVELRRGLVGEAHPDYAAAMRRLGVLYMKTGAFDEARRILEDALATIDAAGERDSLDRARTAKSLADVLSRQGSFPRAIELYEQALEVYERDPTANAEPMIALLLEAGYAYRDADRLDDARLALTRGLDLATETLPAQHPNVGALLNAIGIVYWTEKDFVGARPFFERSLAIYEQVYPEDHPNLAALRNNVGRIVLDAADPMAARPHLEAALATREKILPPDHPDLAATLGNLALLDAAVGEHERAIPLFERTLSIWEAKLEPDHRYLAEPLAGYASSLHAVGRSDEAAPLFERAIAIRSARLGADDPLLLDLLEPYERYLRDSGDLRRAEEIAARADEIRAAAGGPPPDG